MVVRRRGGTFDFVESDHVTPLEPERAEAIKDAYRRARENSLSGRIKKIFNPEKEVIETYSQDFKDKHFNGKTEKIKIFVYSGIIIFLLGIAVWQLLMLFTPDKDELIFNQANEKCAVYVESFCPTKKVTVEGETFDCLWKKVEQKCAVWWKK